MVDFPEPVGPVTNTKPRGSWAKVSMIAGMFKLAKSGMLNGIVRNTAPTEPC